MDELAELLGEHPAIKVVREKLRQLAERQQAGGRLPAILIQGETGTGKGLVARLVHRLGPRPGGPFVDINCAGIPETLLEAELFGFERGAFTDAHRAKPGLFQAADGGTLFLDEVGLLPGSIQAKLLGAIEERVVRRLGSTQPESVDACVISATNTDLQVALRERRFREDLYHRLAGITLDLPALRDRGRDVLLLAERFLARACDKYGLPPKRLDAQAQARLLAYPWPGNIRELANVIERAVLFAESPVVTSEMLDPLQAEGPPPAARITRASAVTVTPDDAMRQHLLAVLEQSEGNISHAAARLGIARNTLYARLEKFGVRGPLPHIVRSRGWAARAMAAPRPLTPILAADVAAYSPLFRADQEGAHERLKAHRRQLVEPKIKEHQGRIIKTTGDGMLVEFPSLVDAMRCAAEVQRGMIDRDAGVPDERRIKFRIGIHLGNVLVEGDDVFGDGVNVAARLEAFAEPGGICVSGTVRDHIRDKLPYRLEDMGEQSVQNIARPVKVYALRPEAVADLPAASVLPEAPRRRGSALAATVAAAAALLVIAVVSAWWLWSATRSSPAPTATRPPAAASISPPAVAPRLSIVVLPFANLDNAPEQQYFADGVTEDLTIDLSRLADMVVISRNTAFTYRNKPVNAKQIGRELGVRYVLEGSVRRSGNRVRVNTGLIDAEADRYLWTERFDRDMDDLFRLQDEITRRIAVTLGKELISAEVARPTASRDALDHMLRGRAVFTLSRDGYAEQLRLYERALALDPRSVEAQSRLASALVSRVLDQMTDSAAADMERAGGLIGQALVAAPGSYLPHYAKAQLLRAQGRCEEAIVEYETLIAIFRNLPSAYANLGFCKFWTGSIDALIPLQEHAIRLNPHDSNGIFYFRIGLAHLVQSRTDQAILWLEKARSGIPAHPFTRATLASAYALKGDTVRAATELAAARRLASDDRYTSIARLKAVGYFGVPTVRALFETTYFLGLRKAGMPEE